MIYDSTAWTGRKPVVVPRWARRELLLYHRKIGWFAIGYDHMRQGWGFSLGWKKRKDDELGVMPFEHHFYKIWFEERQVMEWTW